MPEQFPLTGIAYGQRWVWPPARRTNAQAPFDRVHYVTLYLMQEPLDQTLHEFLELGKELGRRGRFHHQRHSHLSGPFTVAGARASARVLVSDEAVPYRPHRGVHVIVESALGSDDAVARYDAWWRDTHASELCALDGVAGVWRFVTSTRFDAHVWRPGPRRVSVVWIDGDLDSTTARLAGAGDARNATAGDAVVCEMAATLETITPWRWDWFDGA
jgi:hypothetical protein